MLEKLYASEYERTKELVKAPDWYLEFGKVRKARLLGLGAVQATFSGNIIQAASHSNKLTIDIFERLLEESAVRLGVPGQEELDNQDAERQPVNQIVIHHSSRAEGIALPTLNAMHLLNLYVPVYQNKNRPVLNSQGNYQPIYSGHFDESGEQVFYGYHWKVQQDGQAMRLLQDGALGWQAGNWEINKRSVGICIDDDLKHSRPTNASLEAVASIINTYYSEVSVSEHAVIGHNEASSTICPGDQFMGGWKEDLIKRIG